MPLHEVRVRLHDKNFQQLKIALYNVNSEPELVEALASWNNQYRAFLRSRFVKFSRGGGDWKPLTASTVAARRKGKTRPAKKKAVKRKPVKARKAKSLRKSIKGFKKTAARGIKAAVRATKKKVKQAKKGYKKYKREKKAVARVQHSILRDTGAMFAAFQPYIAKITGTNNVKDKIGFRVRFSSSSAVHPQGKVRLADLMGYHHYGSGRLPARKLVVGPDEQLARRMAKRMESAFQKVLNRPGR